MTRLWAGLRDRLDVPCDVDIEHSADSLHVHAIPRNIEIGPGDVVVVHGAPRSIVAGDRVALQCRATVTRASWLGRIWARSSGLLALTELYEVGFEPRH